MCPDVLHGHVEAATGFGLWEEWKGWEVFRISASLCIVALVLNVNYYNFPFYSAAISSSIPSLLLNFYFVIHHFLYILNEMFVC